MADLDSEEFPSAEIAEKVRELKREVAGLKADLAFMEERFATAERQYSALEQRWLRMLGMARKLKRGCDCEYDYRCGRCQAVLDMLEEANRG